LLGLSGYILRIHHWVGETEAKMKEYEEILKDFIDKKRMRKLRSCG